MYSLVAIFSKVEVLVQLRLSRARCFPTVRDLDPLIIYESSKGLMIPRNIKHLQIQLEYLI